MKKCQCCKEKTVSWGIINMKYYCKICRNYNKANGCFPDKKTREELKDAGLWK